MSTSELALHLTRDMQSLDALAARGEADLVRLLDDVVKADGDRGLIADALAATQDDNAAVVMNIAALQVKNPDAYEASVTRLRGAKGASQAVGRWEKAVARKILGLRLGQARDGDVDAPDGVPDGWCVPEGWRMDDRGIWRAGAQDVNQVSSGPMWVLGHLVDVDDGSCLVDVGWVGWVEPLVTEIVGREQIADSRRLLSLAARGAPVHAGNALEICRFLDAAQVCNRGRVPVVRVARRCGWFPDGFMVGEEWVGEQPEVEAAAEEEEEEEGEAEQASGKELVLHASEGEQQLAGGLRQRGTWEGWLKICDEISELPLVWLAIYGAVGSILLDTLKLAEGAVLDWSGETSQGKTTALRVAASVWGRPTEGGFIRTWKDTQARIEGEAAFYFHLPLLLDDTKHLEKDKDGGKKARDVIYSHTSGEGKGRGMQDGGIRRTRSWRSWLLSCGEQRITSFSQDQGSRGRSLCFEGSPFVGRRQAEAVTERVLEHHGHLGRRVLRELLKPYGANVYQGIFATALEEAQEELADAGAVAGRLAKVVAVLATAKQLCEQAGLPAPKCKPLEVALASARASSADSDRPGAALAYIYEVACANPTRFSGRHVRSPVDHESQVPSGGWFGRWDKDGEIERWRWIAWLPFQLRKLLGDGGFDVEGTIERWAERGWLEEGDGRHRMRIVRVDGTASRCFCLRRDAIEAVCG